MSKETEIQKEIRMRHSSGVRREIKEQLDFKNKVQYDGYKPLPKEQQLQREAFVHIQRMLRQEQMMTTTLDQMKEEKDKLRIKACSDSLKEFHTKIEEKVSEYVSKGQLTDEDLQKLFPRGEED